MKRLSGYGMRGMLYLVLIAPLILFGLYAFSTRWFFPQPLPTDWTSAALTRQLSEARTASSLWTSLMIAIVVSVLSLLVGLPAARVLGLRSFRGRQVAWLLLFLPSIVPPLAIGMGLNILFLQIGLAGSVHGVILAHLIPTIPFTVFTLSAVFARYDENYEHQALALGASRQRIFFNVTLRLIAPGLTVAALYAFLISWSQYLLTLLIGGGQVLTLPLLLFSAASGSNPSLVAILSLVFVIPPVLVIAATARLLTQHSGLVREQV